MRCGRGECNDRWAGLGPEGTKRWGQCQNVAMFQEAAQVARSWRSGPPYGRPFPVVLSAWGILQQHWSILDTSEGEGGTFLLRFSYIHAALPTHRRGLLLSLFFLSLFCVCVRLRCCFSNPFFPSFNLVVDIIFYQASPTHV